MRRVLGCLWLVASLVWSAGTTAEKLPQKLFGPQVVPIRQWVELPSMSLSLQITGDLIEYDFAYVLLKATPTETEKQYRVVPGVQVSYPEITVKVDKHAPGRVVVTAWRPPGS